MPEVGHNNIELLKRYFGRYLLYSYTGLVRRVGLIVEHYLWKKYQEDKDTVDYDLSEDEVKEIEKLLAEDFRSLSSKGIRGFLVIEFGKGTLGRIRKPQEYIDFVHHLDSRLLPLGYAYPLGRWLREQFRKRR
jgi:hypothetical protein